MTEKVESAAIDRWRTGFHPRAGEMRVRSLGRVHLQLGEALRLEMAERRSRAADDAVHLQYYVATELGPWATVALVRRGRTSPTARQPCATWSRRSRSRDSRSRTDECLGVGVTSLRGRRRWGRRPGQPHGREEPYRPGHPLQGDRSHAAEHLAREARGVHDSLADEHLAGPRVLADARREVHGLTVVVALLEHHRPGVQGRRGQAAGRHRPGHRPSRSRPRRRHPGRGSRTSRRRPTT